MTTLDGFNYIVVIFLLGLIINSLFNIHALSLAWKENKRQLLQTAAAFVVGALVAWYLGRGILAALNLPGAGNVADWIVSGLILATGSNQLTTLQALGGAPQAHAAPDAVSSGVPEVMQVSGQIRVIK